MAYPPTTVPGEVSRQARTTATGTPFVDITFTLNGDTCRAHVPTGYEDTDEPTLFITLHGHGGTQATIDGGGTTPRRDYFLDLGHIWVSSFAKGNAWASTAGQQAYVDLANWSDTNLINATHHVLHGGSMGGLTAALIYANNLLPKARCAAIIDGALSLSYAHGKSAYQASIRTAYGIASNGSDYATKTGGHDAVLLDPAVFNGKRLQLSASYGDTAIEQAPNTDLFVTNMAGAPQVMEFTQTTGGHVIASHFPVAPFVAFVNASLGWDSEPVPPETVHFPEGVLEVEAYVFVNGEALRADVL